MVRIQPNKVLLVPFCLCVLGLSAASKVSTTKSPAIDDAKKDELVNEIGAKSEGFVLAKKAEKLNLKTSESNSKLGPSSAESNDRDFLFENHLRNYPLFTGVTPLGALSALRFGGTDDPSRLSRNSENNIEELSEETKQNSDKTLSTKDADFSTRIDSDRGSQLAQLRQNPPVISVGGPLENLPLFGRNNRLRRPQRFEDEGIAPDLFASVGPGRPRLSDFDNEITRRPSSTPGTRTEEQQNQQNLKNGILGRGGRPRPLPSSEEGQRERLIQQPQSLTEIPLPFDAGVLGGLENSLGVDGVLGTAGLGLGGGLDGGIDPADLLLQGGGLGLNDLGLGDTALGLGADDISLALNGVLRERRLTALQRRYLLQELARRREVSLRPTYGQDYYNTVDPTYGQPTPDFNVGYNVPSCARRFNYHLNRTFCISDRDYPAYQVARYIQNNPLLAFRLFSDVAHQSANDLVDGLTAHQENNYNHQHYFGNARRGHSDNRYDGSYYQNGGYICPSRIRYVKPKRAQNVRGQWKIIVNLADEVQLPYEYRRFTQTQRSEECTYPEASCSYVATHYNSRCLQKNNYVRMVALTRREGLHIDSFRFPVACSCHVGRRARSFLLDQEENRSSVQTSRPPTNP